MVQGKPPPAAQWTARQVVLVPLTVTAVVLAFWLFYQYYAVAFILFVAIVLGTAIRPLVEGLRRLGLSRTAGVALIYLALLAVVVGLFLLAAPLFTEQVTAISARLPGYYDGLRVALIGAPSRLVRLLALQLPTGLLSTSSALATPAAPGDNSLDVANQLLGYVGLAGRVLFVTTSILVLAYYWTLDGERTIRTLLLRAPADRREDLRDLITAMETKVGAYIVGQTIVCLSVGALALVAYIIIGLPYALVLAVLAAVLEAVPVVGPILGAVPPALLALSLAPGKLIWVIVALVVIQQAENNLLLPRVMDRSVGVSPIVTILAIAAFASLFGLLGALLAIPMAAVIQVVLDRLIVNPAAGDLKQLEGRDRLSILRYETQELVQDVRRQLRRKDNNIEVESDRVEDMIEAIAVDLDSMLVQNGQAEAGA